MISFHSCWRLTVEFPQDEESVLPWKFLTEWANRMNNGRALFADVTGGT